MDLSTLLAALAATPLSGAIPYVTALIAAASVLDAMLPQPAPGSHWLPLRKAISLVAANFWNASNGGQPQLSTWLARVLQPLLPALQATSASPSTVKQADAPAPSNTPSVLGLLAMLAVAGSLVGCTSAEIGTAEADIDQGVVLACTDYEAAKPVGAAVGVLAPDAAPIIASLEIYGDSICSTPAPATDAGTAAWIGQITGQLLTLSKPKTA
jgi:hypothetical protein